MKERLLTFLACPQCGGELNLTATDRHGAEVIGGELTCTSGGHGFPVTRGVPRFVSSDAYVDNFSFEWTVNRVTQLDSHTGRKDSEISFRQKSGFTPAELQGKTVLDIGVGTGRFAEIAARTAGEVIGVDLSFAVDSAYRNLGNKPNVHIVQGDAFRLPFKKDVFDFVYSIGVLHHTPNTRAAFEASLPFLKRGGKIAIWVYDWWSHQPYKLSQFYRKFTTRLPKPILYRLCHLAIPYYYLCRIPGLRYPLKVLCFMADWPDWRWRVLDTFDWYSPKYQWWHTDHEVFTWFSESGLKDIRILELPAALSGIKP